MTWTLQINGHGADPAEEAELRRRARAFVESIRSDIVTEVDLGNFSGTYGGENLLEPVISDGETVAVDHVEADASPPADIEQGGET